MGWLNRLKLGQKIIAGLLVTMMVMAGMVFALYQNKTDEIRLSEMERVGVRYHVKARAVLSALHSYRDISATGAEANAESKAVTAKMEAVLRAALGDLAAIEAELGPQLKTAQHHAELMKKIEAFLTPGASDSMEQRFEAGKLASSELLALMDRVVNSSGLVLDPEAGTFYLMEAATRMEPLTR